MIPVSDSDISLSDLDEYKRVIPEDLSRSAAFIESVLISLQLKKEARILDVGTGFGAMAILLAMNGYHPTTGQPENDPEFDRGISDYEFQDSERGNGLDWKENASKLGVLDMIQFQYLDVMDLGFDDSSFDAVFMYDTLQHIENRKAALNECLRVLVVGGIFCILEWNKRSVIETEKEYGFRIDLIDPSDILEGEYPGIRVERGEFINAFIIQKP